MNDLLLIRNTTWIGPVDHMDDLPMDLDEETACWVGPDLWEMNDLVDSTKKELPEEVEWKGRTLRMDDWGTWLFVEGEWYRLKAGGKSPRIDMTMHEYLKESR